MKSSLAHLAMSQFGEIQGCETGLLGRLQNGDFDASKSGTAHSQTVVGAGLIRWLCANPEARSLLGSKGISGQSDALLGELDLSFVKTDCSLPLLSCSFLETVDLFYADCSISELSGSSSRDVICDALRTRGDLSLENLLTRGRFMLGGNEAWR